jgi:hypothetical protein
VRRRVLVPVSAMRGSPEMDELAVDTLNSYPN